MHRWQNGMAVAGILILFTILILPFWSYTVDDAYISYRYARQLADGNGLVFNLGERVEGYSNLLWTLLLAFGSGWTLDPILLSKIAGFFATATLIIFFGRPAEGYPSKDVFPTTAYAIATSLPLIVWSVAGLETALYTLLVTIGIFLIAQENKKLLGASLLGLAAITRPEGVLFCTIAIVALLWGKRWKKKENWIAVVLLLVPFVLQLIFRRYFYQAWFPNTFHAKMGAGTESLKKGIEYILDFFSWSGAWSILWLLVPVGLIRVWKIDRRKATLYAAAIITQVLFILLAGGDWMKPFRFWVPVLPFLYLFLVEGYGWIVRQWSHTGKTGKWVPRVVFIILLTGLNLAPWTEVRNYTTLYTRGMKETTESLGQWLAGRSSPQDWIALGDCGALPYFSGLQVIDLYGLINPEIARLPGPAVYSEGIDTAAILARMPRFIVLEFKTRSGRPVEGLKPVDQKIYLEPEFQKEYVLIQKAQFSPSEQTRLYQRRDRAGQL